jgi:hypothetical protein
MTNPPPTDLRVPGVHIVDVSPEVALDWLAYNTSNRQVSDSRVSTLAKAIQSGDWKYNGEAIKFSDEGTLLDGQHRLNAVFKAEVGITTVVITGLGPMAQETMDTGAKRSFADVLKLRGEANAKSLAAAISATEEWSRGATATAARSVGSGRVGTTHASYSRWFEAHPELRSAAELGDVYYRRGARNLGLTEKQLSLISWLFDELSSPDRADFMDKLVTGIDLSDGNAILILRNKLLAEKEATSKLPQDHKVALVIKAWNAYRIGKPVGRLTYTPGGATQEKFPVPQ